MPRLLMLCMVVLMAMHVMVSVVSTGDDDGGMIEWDIHTPLETSYWGLTASKCVTVRHLTVTNSKPETSRQVLDRIYSKIATLPNLRSLSLSIDVGTHQVVEIAKYCRSLEIVYTFPGSDISKKFISSMLGGTPLATLIQPLLTSGCGRISLSLLPHDKSRDRTVLIPRDNSVLLSLQLHDSSTRTYVLDFIDAPRAPLDTLIFALYLASFQNLNIFTISAHIPDIPPKQQFHLMSNECAQMGAELAEKTGRQLAQTAASTVPAFVTSIVGFSTTMATSVLSYAFVSSQLVKIEVVGIDMASVRENESVKFDQMDPSCNIALDGVVVKFDIHRFKGGAFRGGVTLEAWDIDGRAYVGTIMEKGDDIDIGGTSSMNAIEEHETADEADIVADTTVEKEGRRSLAIEADIRALLDEVPTDMKSAMTDHATYVDITNALLNRVTATALTTSNEITDYTVGDAGYVVLPVVACIKILELLKGQLLLTLAEHAPSLPPISAIPMHHIAVASHHTTIDDSDPALRSTTATSSDAIPMTTILPNSEDVPVTMPDPSAISSQALLQSETTMHNAVITTTLSAIIPLKTTTPSASASITTKTTPSANIPASETTPSEPTRPKTTSAPSAFAAPTKISPPRDVLPGIITPEPSTPDDANLNPAQGVKPDATPMRWTSITIVLSTIILAFGVIAVYLGRRLLVRRRADHFKALEELKSTIHY